MNINELASKYANTHGGDIVPPCTGLTSDALSEVLKPMMVENSDTGVSTRNALSATHPPLHSTFQTDNSHWYALRTTYGREKKAYDYIISKGGTGLSLKPWGIALKFLFLHHENILFPND